MRADKFELSGDGTGRREHGRAQDAADAENRLIDVFGRILGGGREMTQVAR